MNAEAPRARRRVLFIANGNGEDSIAAAIIRKLPETIAAEAFPVVGLGRAYEGVCPIVGPRFEIPSEGWRHRRGSVLRDIRGGMFSSIWPAIAFLKSARGEYDRVVAVGDSVTPLLCFLAGLPIGIYLDVFKSGHCHHYSALEHWLLRRIAGKVYCRDNMLAETLRAAGVNALSRGNIMLDTVPYGAYDVAPRRKRSLMMTLLPGSREWTAESLAMQVEALRLLPENLMPDLFVAVAGGVDPLQLAAATGLEYVLPTSGNPVDLGTLSGEGFDLHLARGAAGNLIAASDLVLSQAGTATQQALGLGKPVITFDRTDNRRKRMRDEQALMGDSRILTLPDAKALAFAIERLLMDEKERERRGRIGSERLGGPGTLDAVLQDLTN